MMLYVHIYYCALRGLRAACFGELRVPTLHTLLQLLARCSQSNSPHGARVSVIEAFAATRRIY